MFTPEIIAFDYETTLTSGEASVEFFRDDFRVVSCAFSWRNPEGEISHTFTTGEEATRKMLAKIARSQIPVIVHNYQFEYAVTQARFPGIELDYKADTMRLAQVADNGGTIAQKTQFGQEASLAELLGEDEDIKIKTGLSLQACVSRLLDKTYHNHKAPFHEYLREDHGVRKGQEGRFLHLLDPVRLEAYNTADTEVTLRLYEVLTEKFKTEGYDWTFDHALYMSSARLIISSRARGILVNEVQLNQTTTSVTQELVEIGDKFRQMYLPAIEKIENKAAKSFIEARKTEAGRARAAELVREVPALITFNINSTKQKADLFINHLGLEPQFLTKKGAPMFGKAFLPSWGPGGLVLLERGTKSILLAQSQKLLELSDRDGRYHVELKAAGTSTGRFAGAGGLNVQGLARREQKLMGALIADPGHSFVSCDLSAGEPTVTTHFSKDANYYQATFGMVGKSPYYSEDGILMIDDIYLMGMSVSPMGRDKMKQLWASDFNGLSFAEAWVKDPDLIKSKIKADRAFHKILILGLGYSMGPKHMVESAFKAGYKLSLKDAKEFFKLYWEVLFPDLKRLGNKLETQFKRQGYLVNPFGYRLVPDPSYKALNYYIQSSVSGIMHCLCAKFFAIAPYCQFVTVIHDELIFQCPDELLKDAKLAYAIAVESLNIDLNWDVKIRCGWVEGKTLFEAK